MAIHRLSCDCGEAVPVAAGQAGGEIDCPRCGRRIQVPKLRHLRELPRWDDAVNGAAGGPTAASDDRADTRRMEAGSRDRIGGRAAGSPEAAGIAARPGWGGSEAVLAAGSLVAVASLLVAAWLMRPARTGIDAAVIRDAISQVPAGDVYRAWRSLANSGVNRPATPDEERVRKITKNRAAIAVAIGLLGGIGGLAAIGAAAAIVARRRLGGPLHEEFRARSGR